MIKSHRDASHGLGAAFEIHPAVGTEVGRGWVLLFVSKGKGAIYIQIYMSICIYIFIYLFIYIYYRYYSYYYYDVHSEFLLSFFIINILSH